MTDDNNRPTITEADTIHETHANNFRLIPNDREVVLIAGENKIPIDPQSDTDTIVEVDTKIRMDHKTALELRELFNTNIEPQADQEPDRDPGRGVQ